MADEMFIPDWTKNKPALNHLQEILSVRAESLREDEGKERTGIPLTEIRV